MLITEIKQFIEGAIGSFDAIPSERKKTLQSISDYIQKQLNSQKSSELIYVCTHNSRRSHFGQIWGKVAAQYYGIPNVNTYSAGTEVTAMNPNAVNALKRIGFVITKKNEEKNPLYEVKYSTTAAPLQCYSKTYENPSIPKQDLCAIMTCTEADGNCPFIPGTALRVSCPYEDPKAFDGTPEQDMQYDARCKQIATEVLYMYSLVNLPK